MAPYHTGSQSSFFSQKGIDGGLAVVTLYLGKDKPRRVTVVAAAHVCLDSQ